MARTEGEKISRQKYESKAYDQILLKVKKGKRDEYKQAAAEMELGQMEMIRLAIEEFLNRHKGEIFTSSTSPKLESISAADKRLIESFGKCPDNVKPTLKKLIEQLAKGGKENGND